MGVRVRMNGRVVLEHGIKHPPFVRPEFAEGLDGRMEQQWFHPVALEDQSQPRPLEQGDVWLDPEVKILFRVVRAEVLRADQGWQGIDFWLREMRCTYAPFRKLISDGLFDCAMGYGTGARRYRCLDYDRAKAQMRVMLGLAKRRRSAKAGRAVARENRQALNRRTL